MKIASCKIALCFFAIFAVDSAQADNTDYSPQAESIIYRSRVPSSITRSAKKVGPARFFGTFWRDQREFALYLYDEKAVRPALPYQSSDWMRDSRLDVFQHLGKSWKRIQSFGFARWSQGNRDFLVVKAQVLWLDPARATTPLVHVLLAEPDENHTIGYGFRTDVYGVVKPSTNTHPFIVLDGYNPASMSTVTQNKISFPDAQGNLTLLFTVSDPGETSYKAYGWDGKSWKMVAQTQFENRYETAKVWNGTAFVPLASAENSAQR